MATVSPAISKLRSFLARHWVVFLFVLLLLLRLQNLSYPFSNPETSRDYLIAHHLRAFGEYPQVGPPIRFFGGLMNSPAYYYLLAGILYIRDSLHFLLIINIFLQLAGVYLIYLVGKKLFSRTTGFIALLVYSLSWTAVVQSQEIWQPYIMFPFLMLGVYFLSEFYLKEKYQFLLASLVVFAVAGVLHLSAFGLGPVFFVLAFLMLKKQGRPISNYVFAGLGFLISFSALYAPLLFYNLKNHLNAGVDIVQSFQFNFFAYLRNLGQAVLAPIDIFFQQPLAIGPWLFIFVPLVFLIVYYLRWSKKGQEHKNRIRVLIWFLVMPVVLAAFSDKNILTYYFVPTAGILALVFAETLAAFLKEKEIFNVNFVGLILCVILFFSNFFQAHAGYGQTSKLMDLAAKAIENQVSQVKKDRGWQENSFFQIEVYRYFPEKGETSNIKGDALFWVPLEKEFGQKFTQNSSDLAGYKVLAPGPYIFMICQNDDQVEDSACLRAFFAAHAGYRIAAKVYFSKPFSIYLATK